VSKLPNISGINYERSDEVIHRKGVFARLISVILTVLALVFVVFLLFNPVKIRPSFVDYGKQFNAISAKQGMTERLPETPIDFSLKSAKYSLKSSGLNLELYFDTNGYISGLKLSDDENNKPSSGWLMLTPVELRAQIYRVMAAIDPKRTVVSLYQTFAELDINLDQPIGIQPTGTRETNEGGLTLNWTNDAQHFTLMIHLDVIEE
jgi:hypothetical protein